MSKCSASKNPGAEEKRDGRGRLLPVRIHELLGIPKSAGESKNANGSIIERPRLQPVRIKDLLASMSSCKKPNPNARRMTVAPGGTTNARRQLHDETSDRWTPEKTSSSNAGLPGSSNRFVARFDGNAGSRTKSRPVQLLGVSKSEGKNMRTNGHGAAQPERMKDLTASWEKSQTVKQRARKSMMVDIRAKNVRRKLYDAPSPVAAPRIARKSLASHKLQSQKNAASQRRSVKPEPKKTAQTKTRKSCLLPPNFIRDKHINRQHNETIKEESPTALLNDNELGASEPSKEPSALSSNNYPDIQRSAKNSLEEILEIEKPGESTRDDFEPEETSRDDEKKEAPLRRSTVIKAAISNIKWSPKSPSDSCRSSNSKKSSFTLSRPVLDELKRNAMFPQRRLDAETSSIEDLLGNSRFNNDESFDVCNLPRSSFLERLEVTKNSPMKIDKQTVSWMHANLKLSIQSAEETLFSMKQMLRALEELLDKDSSKEEERSMPKIRDEATSGCEKVEEDKSPKVAKNQRELPVVVVTGCVVDSEDFDANEEKSTMDGREEENKENVFANENSETEEKSAIDASEEENKENVVANENSETEEKSAIDASEEEDKENVFANGNSEIGGENGPRRRSARLAAMEVGRSPKNSDDSFSIIERELNIFYDRSRPSTPRVATPMEGKKLDPRSRRSMREYMALKSMMNCLQTPDVKGLPTPKSKKTETPAQLRANKRSLSRQLMNELDDLYDESPQ